ncbi:MAG: hypothetical protein D6B27_03210 [Gammaproteobacteria bacterium]|nr:MAG: hypothetical protein D6B27_03210 [Gammaproteobacteria bacterium]
MKKIFITIIGIFLALGIISLIHQGNLWYPLMIILGATVGIPLIFQSILPVYLKVALTIGLFLSFTTIIYGFKKQNILLGQVLFISGIISWSLIGIIGLGTGS